MRTRIAEKRINNSDKRNNSDKSYSVDVSRLLQVTWPRWPPYPYMLKPLKNLLWNWWTDFNETWHVAFMTKEL